jgi:hypothetical protein
MKAMTLKQPWATLIAEGVKTIEIRTWGTRFRGRLAIHAGKGWDQVGAVNLRHRFLDLGNAMFEKAREERGKVIAVATLAEIREYMDPDRFLEDAEEHMNDFSWFEPGLIGWVFQVKTIRRLEEPIPYRGSLGLWDWPEPEDLKTTNRRKGVIREAEDRRRGDL